jgi:hypothetical protein
VLFGRVHRDVIVVAVLPELEVVWYLGDLHQLSTVYQS